MRRNRFGEEQIIVILREHEAGAATSEVCRRSLFGAGPPVGRSRYDLIGATSKCGTRAAASPSRSAATSATNPLSQRRFA
jgi:hypothetical protein